VKTSEVRTALALNRALAKQQIRRNDATLRGERAGPVRTLRCRVVGVEGTYRAPNLLKFHLPPEERTGNLQPKAFRLLLEGELFQNDQDAMGALAELSRTGGSVTVRVEVGE
jgi:hypothetical protein